MIRTVDTDVVIITMFNLFELEITELWVEFGSGPFAVGYQFIKIREMSIEMSETDKVNIERFVVLMYDRTIYNLGK